MAVDAFSAALAADRREIIFAPTVYKYPTFAMMAEALRLSGRDVIVTNRFLYSPFMEEMDLPCAVVLKDQLGEGEPSESMIQALFDAVPYDSYDRVVTVGGGAVLDMGKLLGIRRPDSVHELYFKRFPVVREKQVVAVPATCGTGSEVTNISVAIVDDEREGVLTGSQTKLGLVSDELIPGTVCLVPELLRTLPYKAFACSAIDALIHATESFLSPHRKTMTSELFSVRAMELILEGFRSVAERDPEMRMEWLDQFLTASMYAGLAFQKAGCATVHAMSFPLGGSYHVPHGESNYMLFGAILRLYDEKAPGGEPARFKAIAARILGCAPEEAISVLKTLLEKILPLRPLRDCGFTEADLKAFPQSVEANQQRLITNSYVPMDIPCMERIYSACY